MLRHPNLVREKRSFHISHSPCLVLEYVPGETSLASRIASARQRCMAKIRGRKTVPTEVAWAFNVIASA